MKKTTIAAGMAMMLFGIAALYATPRVVKSYRVSEPVALRSPAIGDSVGIFGKIYDASELLETKQSFDIDRLANSIQETDTAGILSLQTPSENLSMTLLQTSMRPERYMKGKLKVVSPARFEVIVNGESKGVKSTAEDSITNASTLRVPLEMEPQRLYTIGMRVLNEAGAEVAPTISATFEPEEGSDSISLEISPELQQRVMLETTAECTRVASTYLSPDGKYYITHYSHFYNQKHTRRWSTLTETKTGKVLLPDLTGQCQWMPTGSTLYFTQKSDNGLDLFTLDPSTMTQKQMLSDIPEKPFMWAPNGEWFLYYADKEAEMPSGPMRRYLSPEDRQPGDRDRQVVMKYDVASGIAYPLVYEKDPIFVNDISADSRYLLYAVSRQRPAEYPFFFTDIIRLDLQTMATDTIIKNEGQVGSHAIFSPRADKIFLVGGPSFQNGLGISGLSPDQPIVNDYDMQGYIIDIASRKATPVTKDFNPSLNGRPIWNRADGKIYFTAENGFYVDLYVLDPANGNKISRIDTEVEYVLGFSVGQYEDQWISYNGQGFNTAGSAYLMQLRTGKQTLIADPMGETLAKTDLGKLSHWTFTSDDGTEIDGIYVTPPHFDPAKKYPMIVYYYGGTSPVTASLMQPYAAQLLASRDYVVYILNPSGSTGYGQEFSTRHVNAWGDRTSDDIITGVKKFCEAHPFVDADKVGCMGASYGGFMTQYLLTRTDIFACAISHAGISNVTSYWGEGYWGYSYNSVAAAKSYPWNNPDLFTKHGSLFNADKIHTPLLLLHGTSDTNVPIGESIQIFTALKLLNRDVEFVSVDGEDHYISNYDKRKLWHATIMAWFAKWLQDDPRWWNSMYPD